MKRPSNQHPDPTPAEIREACRAIRAEWSEREERVRRAEPFIPARIPGADKFVEVAPHADDE